MEKTLEQYLNAVDRKLRPLPLSERVDIVREIKSSMQEMQAEGLAAEAILERLGRPEALARAYLSDLMVQPQRSGWKKLLTLLAFYSVVGMSGMVVIPVLGICAPTFLLCGVVVPLAGLVKFLAWYPLGIDIPYIAMQFGPFTPPVALGFVCSLVAGALLCLLGVACWRLLMWYLRTVGNTRDRLAS